MFNELKCEQTSSRIITYLWVVIDLDMQTLNLTKKIITKVVKELIKIRKYNITRRYKQRIEGLLIFPAPLLKLPAQIVNLAFFHHQKLYKFVNFIHHYKMSYCSFINTLPVFTDATPHQIGVLAPYEKMLDIFKSENNILENEFIGIFIAHIFRSYSPILTENTATCFFFERAASLHLGGPIIKFLGNLSKPFENL